MEDFLHYIIQPYENYTKIQISIEIIAVILGVLSVWFSSKNSIWVFPTGIVNTGIYIYILTIFSLYGDMVVNCYFFFMSIYGWIHWTGKDNNDIDLPITRISKSEIIYGIVLFFISAIFVNLVYQFFHWYSGNKFEDFTLYQYTWINYIDTFTTSIFFVGMWLMAKRKVENWLFWILGDLLVIPMFIHKGLAITALQYVLFLVLAIYGFFHWRKLISTEKN